MKIDTIIPQDQYWIIHKSNPKIIAMTANVQIKDKEMCFGAGMTDYISKPISFKKMKYLIEYWGSIDQRSTI